MKKNILKRFSEKIDLKLNIPKTEFSDRINIKEVEQNNIDRITVEFYKKQSQLNRNTFQILDGPPFPTGKPHLGTIMNKVFKDVINRIKIMQGYKVDFNLNFDCNGIEIEDLVLKLKHKKKITNIDDLYEASIQKDNNDHRNIFLQNQRILQIRQLCRQFINESIIEQINYYKRIGISFNPADIQTTSSKLYALAQFDIFKNLYEKGIIYRDHRIVFWSANDHRILDFYELEERTELSDSLIVKFPVFKYSGNALGFKDAFPNLKYLGFITEPWKYVGIRALSINEEIYYCIVKIEDEHFLCAYKRLPELAKRYNNSKPEILYSALGKEFVNVICQDPLFKRELPIVVDNDVSQYFGTGINILSPAHDNVSEKICRGHNLSQEGFIDEDNNFTLKSGLERVNIYSEGNATIMYRLRKYLFITWKYENKYYVSIETGERVPLRSISSWFLKLDSGLKAQCLKELAITKFTNEIKFQDEEEKTLKYQPHKKRTTEKPPVEYINVVEELDEIEEWCISEFNSWGIPIPYFVYPDGSVLLNTEIIENIKKLIVENDIDIWWKLPDEDLLPVKYRGIGLQKGRENFDSWFDSSIIWYINDVKGDNDFSNNKIAKPERNEKEFFKHLTKLNRDIMVNNQSNQIQKIFPKEILIEHINNKFSRNSFIPYDLVIEGHDQHNFWYLYSLIASVSINRQLCFKTLKTHGFIMNSAGKKLSKSLKNFIDPLDIIDGSMKQSGEREFGYGSDVLRIYFCQNDSDKDFKLFEEDMEKSRDQLKLIKKTAKLCLCYLNNYNPTNDQNKLEFENLDIIEQILLHEYFKYLEAISKAIDEYNLSEYYKKTYEFISNILYRYYLDVSKYYYINYPSNDKYRIQLQQILKEVFSGVYLILTPVIPFSNEDMYKHTHFNNKKEFMNLELLPNIAYIKEKYQYKFNKDLDFNIENLLYIRNALTYDSKYRKRIKNDLELHIINNEDSYEYLLIMSLDKHMKNFFGFADTVFDPLLNTKVSRITNKRYVDGQSFYIGLSYSLVQTDKVLCDRCLLYRSEKKGKLCEECNRIINNN